MGILACIRYVDAPVAQAIWEITSSLPKVHGRIQNIPNTLPVLVAIGTATLWLAYATFSGRKGMEPHTGFLKIAAVTIPAAYLAKVFLQDAFGRTNTRFWLKTGGPIEFRWFHPIQNGGFPSGHSLVFTAFLAAVWIYYPRSRPLAVVAVAALGSALLLTSYHFVSDIISGIMCGIYITAAIHHILAPAHPSAD
ncbi:MAG: phosphatase PAP2 family protein [Geobacteraceae bacterium]|nr:phosphatase PAP2 family protein [Geobacteraceae bacterium]